MDLLQDLNEPQRAAVLHPSGPLLIFAGAGSGKTRTLTRRIARLVLEERIPASRILAVTFTNKAAKEMRERLDHLIGREAKYLWMGTFHALCAQMLRIHGEHIGLAPRFVIFDGDDQLRVVKDVLRELDLDSERNPPARMLGAISDWKNSLATAEDATRTASSPPKKLAARVYAAYQKRLQAQGGLDFDDLLMQAVRLLRESQTSREFWSDKFQHILIDEFQDVNAAQFEWAKLLAAKHRNICVVGDDDQSIYQWRGADVKIILDFERQFEDAQVVRLEQNYRSTQNILDAAHGVIAKNLGRKPKRLWTQEGGGKQVLLHGAANAQEEALWVVRQVELLRRERRGKLADFAILCRVNAQSRPFEEAFMRARVPLKLIGTQRFYDRKEIRDLVSYLKVLYNPNDALALSRIINVPARGIGATTVERLQAISSESGLSLYETIFHSGAEVLGRTIDLKLENLRRVLRALEDSVKDAKTVVEVIDQVLERTGYLEFLRNEKEGRGVDRAANIEEFSAAAGDFDARMEAESWGEAAPPEGAPYLGLFLETSALDNAADKNGEAEDAVSLMTLHSAKGLEFPVVFMVGMEQGLLPHGRALWGEGAGESELEEERRLCYVGMTRAREQLILTNAAQRTMHGRTETTQPSQFLDEVPDALFIRTGLAAGGGFRSQATRWEMPERQRYGPKATIGNTPVSSTSAGTSAASTRPSEPLKFSIGDRVRHPSFGEGVVVNTSSSGGAGEWAEVAFLSSEVGKKKLAVSFAPLEKVA
jgi:DNA helicase-2/ATP-dependent DNA helicase PcrA